MRRRTADSRKRPQTAALRPLPRMTGQLPLSKRELLKAERGQNEGNGNQRQDHNGSNRNDHTCDGRTKRVAHLHERIRKRKSHGRTLAGKVGQHHVLDRDEHPRRAHPQQQRRDNAAAGAFKRERRHKHKRDGDQAELNSRARAEAVGDDAAKFRTDKAHDSQAEQDNAGARTQLGHGCR